MGQRWPLPSLSLIYGRQTRRSRVIVPLKSEKRKVEPVALTGRSAPAALGERLH